MKENKQRIITRFAPSPTGFLHMGTYRTALFNFLFSKQNNGELILRIEDTDRERSKKEYEDNILESLAWLGLSYTSMYRQSERVDKHKAYLETLIKNGSAYISKEIPKEGGRAEVIRFKNPNKKVSFTDLIRGEIEMDTTDLGDFVIAKSLDEPIFHLAVVADDFDMGVTHIIRGDDHISNTPRQILIQEALHAPRPIYAHLPLILAPDRTKLSKRKGAKAVTEYREEGFLPEALVNFMALLGFNPGGEQEIFSLPELITLFDISKVQKGGAIFNEVKLRFMNKEHIKKLPLDVLVQNISEVFPAFGKLDAEKQKKLAGVIIERSETFGEVGRAGESGEWNYLFETPTYDKVKLTGKNSTSEETQKHLAFIQKTLEGLTDFTAPTIKNALWDYATEKGRGNVLWPFRFCLSGKEKSPDPFTLADILGKEETLKRVKIALA